MIYALMAEDKMRMRKICKRNLEYFKPNFIFESLGEFPMNAERDSGECLLKDGLKSKSAQLG